MTFTVMATLQATISNSKILNTWPVDMVLFAVGTEAEFSALIVIELLNAINRFEVQLLLTGSVLVLSLCAKDNVSLLKRYSARPTLL